MKKVICSILTAVALLIASAVPSHAWGGRGGHLSIGGHHNPEYRSYGFGYRGYGHGGHRGFGDHYGRGRHGYGYGYCSDGYGYGYDGSLRGHRGYSWYRSPGYPTHRR
jgi:hypothetical protein